MANVMDINSLELSYSSSEWKVKRSEIIGKTTRCVCALLNSSGGQLILCMTDTIDGPHDDGEALKRVSSIDADMIIRPVEQRLQKVLDTFAINKSLGISHQTFNKITLTVEGLSSLCTLQYNMFVPTDTQVLSIGPVENDKVREILNANRLVDVTDSQTNIPKTFQYDRPLGVRESKTVQFKILRTDSKNFGSRMINSNLTHYVSAFANDRGGRIYYGVEDDGTVKGEKIEEKDEADVTKEVRDKINAMKWPDHITPDAQWDISFKHVQDNEDNAIPSVSVIVLFVAACPGGVFVKEPESYHIIAGEVKRMTIAEWKNRLLYPDQEKSISRSMSRIDWSTHAQKLRCDALDGKLLRLINLGKWEEFQSLANEQHTNNISATGAHAVQIRLVLLSKWFMYCYRKDKFDEAIQYLNIFNDRLPKSMDSLIFGVRGRLLLSAMERTRGNHEKSYEIAKKCLSDVDLISPCILTAEFYVHFATMLTIIESKKELRDKLKNDLTKPTFKEEAIMFYDRALQHLRNTEYVPHSKADMEQKTYINLALLKLGCSLSGDVVADHRVAVEDIKAASTSLGLANNLVTEKYYPLTGFRKCHHSFALSSLFYRKSQLETTLEKSVGFLESAIEYGEDAKGSAKRHDFKELLRYSEKHVCVSMEELERKKYTTL